jgi:hypothetical protein
MKNFSAVLILTAMMLCVFPPAAKAQAFTVKVAQEMSSGTGSNAYTLWTQDEYYVVGKHVQKNSKGEIVSVTLVYEVLRVKYVRYGNGRLEYAVLGKRMESETLTL